MKQNEAQNVIHAVEFSVFGGMVLWLAFMVPGAIDVMLMALCLVLPVLLLLAGSGLISSGTVELVASLRDSEQREKVRAAVKERFSS